MTTLLRITIGLGINLMVAVLECPPRPAKNVQTAKIIVPATSAPPRRSGPWVRNILPASLAVLAGVMHAVAWVYPGLWAAAWVAQALLCLIAVVCTPRWALLYGFITGAIGIAWSFHWGVAALYKTFDATPFTAWSVFTGLVTLEALGFGLFCWAASHLARRGPLWMWLAPCVWAAVEYWFPRVFPWKMGYSQLEVIPLIQVAELFGPTAIGFVMTVATAIPAVLVVGFLRGDRRSTRAAVVYALGANCLLVGTLTYGAVTAGRWDAWCQRQPKLKVALVQVDPSFIAGPEKLRRRSLEVQDDVDLLCWPESSLGVYSEKLKDFRDRRQTMRLSRDSFDTLEPARELKRHLLAGGKLYEEEAGEEGPYRMTGYLISPEQEILGRYSKRTLLPFGEYIPGQQWYPQVREWATLRDVVAAGKDPHPLVTADGKRLGVVICYEDTLPRNGRITVAEGAEALFSLIQGAAFENPLTLVQHQRLAALRAVENRRYFARCASTGLTCAISPTGRLLGSLPMQTEGTLKVEIALVAGRTLYNRIGDAFPLLCTLLLLLPALRPRT